MFTWWKKDELVSWVCKGTLYISVVFSWQIKEAKLLAKQHKGKVVVGGPAAMTHKDVIDWAEVRSSCEFDTLAMQNPFATFTSRGCIRRCPFCVVSKVEGNFVELDNWKPAPIICDNNLTTASKKHFEKVIDSVKHFPFVDINQGMDARLFNKWHAEQLQRLQAVKIRFAFDDIKLESKVVDAFRLCKDMGFRDFGCYVLIGFNDTPDEAKYKLELIKNLNVFPMPMRFQPWDTEDKNTFVGENWTHQELQDTVRYYARSAFWSHDFEGFQKTHGSRKNKIVGNIRGFFK